ncbi:hypothetical protein BD779DRAFT_1435288 [Infundibulicybe gibba]|nr:hypothetical protein BD779DRAFT_1435288 [Infundibulicybe gibba]
MSSKLNGPAASSLTSQDTASLMKRLAGPSTGKAGLAHDQTEINRVITEASKGSKFYENEKKKDKDLTDRIEKILAARGEALKGADIEKVESSVDQLLTELESQRDLSQTIVHVDMDAFYASVELLHDPELHDKPFAVGRGVLTTASYEARKHGIRSGMPEFIAKKLCPSLIVVPNVFSRYIDMSNKVMEIFKRYDPNMCAAGCDEGYLNITAYCHEHGLSVWDCVERMRKTVFEETRLTVSAGIAPNKNKPNGQYQIAFDAKEIVAFMRDLSIRKIPFIGRVNERLLESIGIKTCGDIFTHRGIISLMDKQFGLKFLLRTYLGIGSNAVQPIQRGERKSIGVERTFAPIGDSTRILKELDAVAVELEKDMRVHGWSGRTITLKFKLETYQVFTRAKSFLRWINTKDDLYATGKELLLPEFPLKIRLIGLRVTKLKDLQAQPTTDVMPGFHEDDETDDMSQKHLDEPMVDEDYLSVKPISSQAPHITRQKPSSLNSSNASIPKLEKASNSSVSSSRRTPLPGDQRIASAESLECPICGRTLITNNDGFNTHLDFCLSRQEIMKTQAESNNLVRRNTPKPTSAGKRRRE